MLERLNKDTDENDLLKLTEAVYQKYGYDFSDYSPDSFRRRVQSFMIRFAISDQEELIKQVIKSDLFFNTFLEEITVNVTEMFRDPEFFKTLRDDVIPLLADSPLIRVWHAGCSTGQEVYSLAIVLDEAGLLDKSLLYATDINQLVLEKAASGKFSLQQIELYSKNYLDSGGLKKLTDYYHTEVGFAIFDQRLKNRMVFSAHNLTADQSFNEFNLILCRNVLIYFNQNLQKNVIRLFADSLPQGGFLALGSKEGIDLNYAEEHLDPFNRRQRIWKKKN